MKSLELFDETLDINSTENYDLAIQVCQDGFSFSLLDTLRNKVVLIRAFEPDDNKLYNSDNVREFIEKDDFLTKKYKKTRVVLPSSMFTVVPAPLYDPAKKNEYYDFNLKRDADRTIMSNKNTDPDLFIVFSVNKSLDETIKRFFPGIDPFVHLLPLLDHVSRERRSIHGNYIHVHIERDYFNLIIFSSGDLKFCNSFRFRSPSDILYYLLNVFNKLRIKQEETIHLSGFTGKSDELSSVFGDYVRSVKFAAPRGNFTFSYVFNDIELHKYLTLFSVFNCE